MTKTVFYVRCTPSNSDVESLTLSLTCAQTVHFYARVGTGMTSKGAAPSKETIDDTKLNKDAARI